MVKYEKKIWYLKWPTPCACCPVFLSPLQIKFDTVIVLCELNAWGYKFKGQLWLRSFQSRWRVSQPEHLWWATIQGPTGGGVNCLTKHYYASKAAYFHNNMFYDHIINTTFTGHLLERGNCRWLQSLCGLHVRFFLLFLFQTPVIWSKAKSEWLKRELAYECMLNCIFEIKEPK